MKKIKIIICFFFLICVTLPKAYSYQNFDGKYNYAEYDGNTNVSINNEQVLFIVDYSGSMSSRLGFTPKAYLVLDAINNILDKTDDSRKIGLRVFGVTDKPMLSYERTNITLNKENLCTASTLILPISKYNSQNIQDKLSNMSPKGATPIGYSLRQAVQNDFLNDSSVKHIILITDGAENCGDDPCLYIKKLMTLRNDIKIDVIGITVDENAYSQLKCISDAGKGKYYDIKSEDEFNIKFMQAFDSKPKISTKTKSTAEFIPPRPDSGIKYKNYVFQFDY